MDQDEELANLKPLALAGVFFLGSAFYSFQELKFAVWGATAEATVIETLKRTKLGSPGKKILSVKYRFTDEEGNQHQERDEVPADWAVPQDKVTVQYLPGVEESSRLEGHSNAVIIWIFLGCVAFLGFCIYRLYREANEPVHGKRRKR